MPPCLPVLRRASPELKSTAEPSDGRLSPPPALLTHKPPWHLPGAGDPPTCWAKAAPANHAAQRPAPRGHCHSGPLTATSTTRRKRQNAERTSPRRVRRGGWRRVPWEGGFLEGGAGNGTGALLTQGSDGALGARVQPMLPIREPDPRSCTSRCKPALGGSPCPGSAPQAVLPGACALPRRGFSCLLLTRKELAQKGQGDSV